ncbi:MAG: shikimate dehydrogenase [Deltaproteobacteria bacterium]|nr:shikimate dehydrogenase [Deltaproteobacteria bacterium]
MLLPKTKLFIIGHPIGHSLSPPMQMAVLKKLNLRYSYSSVEVLPEELPLFIRKIRQNPYYLGFNATLPHKETLIPFLDYVCPEASLISAVNTVVVRNKRLLGFNTDGNGFIQGLKLNSKFEPFDKNIVLLGAGGASRAIAINLLKANCKKLSIYNRHFNRAHELVSYLKPVFPGITLEALALDVLPEGDQLENADLLVNATSLGLQGTQFNDFPWAKLKTTCVVSDIVYNPLHTHFLIEAEKRGLPILTGDFMLVHQGALAFELWTGHKPPIKTMHQALLHALNK